ncbi:hypothetical protein BMW22_14420 [Rhizobium leguminosarum]|uniref:Uncharacterized protein n=1 Tax=Rhizobium leguminosarum TaxID=384 RepID=A0A1L3ZAR2_RHILE|nr:hypothetical protein BMW22_14420 [Rhizobium leguminosarum]
MNRDGCANEQVIAISARQSIDLNASIFSCDLNWVSSFAKYSRYIQDIGDKLEIFEGQQLAI